MTDEYPVQEVRYCLKTLRKQMEARQNNNTIPVEAEVNVNGTSKLSDVPCRGIQNFSMSGTMEDYRKLQSLGPFPHGLNIFESKLLLEKIKREEQKNVTEIPIEMQMDSLKLENATLQKKLSANQAELEKLRKISDDKCEELEKELEIQQHKNRSLDDMLKSQQRKLRNMIEQVQNARTIIDNRTTQVRDLKEKVSFLEAENKELQDRLCHLDKREQPTNNPDKGFFSPGKKTLPFMMARIKN